MKAQEARDGLEDKEREADGGWWKAYVMMVEQDNSSHWTNLMELKAFDRREYNT